jgi:phage-related protein
MQLNVWGRTVLGLTVSVVLLAGCGGSSKPSYCSSVNDLKNSIKALPSTDVIKNGTSALQSAFSKVQDNATAVVDDAKSDFPTETTAVKNSVDALSNTVKQVSSSPSAATIAQLPGEVSAVVTAVQSFTSAASSKCG